MVEAFLFELIDQCSDACFLFTHSAYYSAIDQHHRYATLGQYTSDDFAYLSGARHAREHGDFSIERR